MSNVYQLDDYRPKEKEVSVLVCECGCATWMVTDNSLILCIKCRERAPGLETVYTDDY